MKSVKRLVTFAGLGIACSTSALAVPIADLIDTGSGLGSAVVDVNWDFGVIAGNATGVGGHGQTTDDTLFPMQYWMSNASSPASKWLTPGAQAGTGYDQSSAGIYTWTQTFDLTGFNASSATISGRWAADNTGTVSINGVVLASGQITDPGAFTGWTSFSSAGANFVSGLNTITFTVTNDASATALNPTGVRVEFTASDVTPVPETSTTAMMALGLALMSVLVRRRGQIDRKSRD